MALFAAYGLVRHGPAWLDASRDRQKAQADAASAEAGLARERAEEVRLERHRRLHGWSSHELDTFAAVVVAAPEEMDQARAELTGGGPTSYVIMRVAEGEGTDSANRARRLRQVIESEGFISRMPSAAEREALEKGFITLGIARAPKVFEIPRASRGRRPVAGTTSRFRR
ncbi:MAG TPA: hypothetical protein VGM53_35220 [Streptosporangiaceae bacterium]